MPITRRTIIKFVFWALAIILVLIIAAVAWLYSGALTPPKIKIFRILPMPIALVNGQPLFMKDYLVRDAVAQKTLGRNSQRQTALAVVQQMINEAEVSQLAAQEGVSVSQKQIDDEYLAVSERANLHGQKNFEIFLQSQGLNENFFKNNIIKPELLLNQLRIWVNSQPNLNSQAYQSAGSLLKQINSGGDMADLASRFTQNLAGKSSGGDMGFVQITDLSRELRESVSALKPGETKIIPGLEGLFIIRLEGQSGNRLHLREIFLNTNDFNSWLDSHKENFKIIKLLKF